MNTEHVMQGIDNNFKRSVVAASLATVLSTGANAATAPEPVMVPSINSGNANGSSISNIVTLGDKIYFRGIHAEDGYAFWRANYDGSSPEKLSTTYSEDVAVRPDNLISYNGKIYYQGIIESSGISTKNAMFEYDPITNTITDLDLNPGDSFNYSDTFKNPYVYNGKLYFSAQTGETRPVPSTTSITGDYELWVKDGDAAPVRLADINLGEEPSNPNYFTAYKGKLYFQGRTASQGVELMVYDDSQPVEAGINPSVVFDLPGQDSNSNPNSSSPAELVVYNNALYFTATMEEATGKEIYFYTGEGEPTLLSNVTSEGQTEAPSKLTVYAGHLLFTAGTGINSGSRIWIYNSLNSAPELLSNKIPGATQVEDANHFTVYHDRLYFEGNQGNFKDSLWVMDGISSPTLVTDFNPVNIDENDNLVSEQVSALTVANGRLYFSANAGQGQELYIIDEFLDSDGDLVRDELDAYPNDPTRSQFDEGEGGSFLDSDGDGVLDHLDWAPNDASESKDSDGDGVGNNADAFPFDKTETVDTDGDGIGDNADPFPESADSFDSDGDGVLDVVDAFPLDPTETMDSDGDGIGDNTDKFPQDAMYHADADNDGVADSLDAFPTDENESVDSDGDGVGDNADKFPNDKAASIDTDGDGYPDSIVADIATDLVVDSFPDDATEFVDTDQDGVGDNADGFPTDNTKSADLDRDGIEDLVDTDQDGDGYSDELELEFGSDPIVASSIPYQKIELASDIRAGSSSSTPKYFTEFNGKTYFQANGGTNGIELYVYDGTSTELVFDIRTGTSSSSPVELVVNATGDTMYFVASDGTDKALWSLSDVDGAVPVKVAAFATTAD
ncbi:thrombospondin type 3 repeat-containing protein, partial [Psychrosphaera sp. B3R10]|uniref:thrombospondin type 3 repeat-containing protein n=2 Tax=unclassified Psychrosphaera TaxID=2641570 RepID=UPI001C097E43